MAKRKSDHSVLTYCAVARKGQNHHSEGFVYLHSWAGGFQEIVFASHVEAQRYAELNGLEYRRGNIKATGETK